MVGMELREIANRLGLSFTRIYQIEKRAINKITKRINYLNK